MITSNTVTFYHNGRGRFMANDFRHCPRYLLMKQEGIEHGAYTPLIDRVFDSVVNAANEALGVELIDLVHLSKEAARYDYLIPMAKSAVTLSRVIMSGSLSQMIRDGVVAHEDSLICGLYLHLLKYTPDAKKLANLHYIQPRSLTHHHRVLPVLYRPFFCSLEGGRVLVNCNNTGLHVDLALDGVDMYQEHVSANTLPAKRPLPLTAKDDIKYSCCDYCPYADKCKAIDRAGITSLGQIEGLTYTPNEKNS